MRVVVGLVALIGAASCQGSALDVSSTSQYAVTVLPAAVDFGTVLVHGTAGPSTVTVRPQGLGASSDSITAIAPTTACPDFAVSAPGLPAFVYRTCNPTCPGHTICQPNFAAAACAGGTDEEQDYPFSVSFTPTVSGPLSCVVAITLASGSTSMVSLSGTGMAPPVQISAAPANIAFGDVRAGTDSSPATVTIGDLGGSPLTVTSAAVSGGFVLGGSSAFSVPPGGAQALTVTCHAPAVGPVSGQLVITSNDTANSPLTIPLTCAGVSSNLEITPSPATLPPTLVGNPIVQHVVIANAGSAPTTVTSLALDGEGLTLVTPLPGATALGSNGGALGIDVQFDAAAHGATSGTLTVGTSDGTRTSQITASALLASLSLSPDGAVDLGPVCAGATTTQLFTVVGNGDGPFDVTGLSTPDMPFTLTAPTLPASVAAMGGNQVTFNVDVAPAAAGPLTTSVMVTTDIPGDAGHAITVTATGLAAGTTATPAELDFGTSPLEATSLGQAILLTNCSAASLGFSTAQITGSDASEFAIVAPPAGTSIAPNASAAWLVVLSAHTAGVKTAAFSVDTADGTTSTVTLLGEGFDAASGSGSGEAPGERNYYSCSTREGAGGLAPLGVALVLVARRRRRTG